MITVGIERKSSELGFVDLHFHPFESNLKFIEETFWMDGKGKVLRYPYITKAN